MYCIAMIRKLFVWDNTFSDNTHSILLQGECGSVEKNPDYRTEAWPNERVMEKLTRCVEYNRFTVEWSVFTIN
jgi:hypothetical protein